MVVKAVRGRRRYVVYTVPADVGREKVLAALAPYADRIPEHKVITSFGGKAIVRCEPGHVAIATEAMRASWPESESLISSGTLRTVRDRYPELKVPQKRKR